MKPVRTSSRLLLALRCNNLRSTESLQCAQAGFDKFMDLLVDGAHTETISYIVSDTEPGTSKAKPTIRGRKRAISPIVEHPTTRCSLVPIPNLSIPIIYSSLVHILHPSHYGEVAQGKVGASWKNTKTKFGPLCEPGQQMVQVLKIVVIGVPLMFLESQHHAMTLDGALSVPKQKPLWIKWETRYMVKL
jgi:hypothetical protein